MEAGKPTCNVLAPQYYAKCNRRKFMYHDTTKEMWDGVNDTYSNVDNTSSIFKIKSLLYDLKQGESSITKYLNALSRHWQQLDEYEEIEWKISDDKKKYKKLNERDRIYNFLLGLNKDLGEVQGRVLGTNHCQSCEKCYQKYEEKIVEERSC